VADRPITLVAGTINTDLVARVARAPAAGETVTGNSFEIFGGGKAANQAVAAARSGAAVAMLGAVGDDDFGRQRIEDLKRGGIDAGDVAVVSGVASGVALIVVEEATGQNRIAYVPGATATVTAEQASRAVERLRPRVVLATLELPAATLATLFAAARAAGATILLNATPEAAAGRDLVRDVDVLIVNETEAADLLGYPVTASNGGEAALALTRFGPASVAVTLGAAGAVVAHGGAVSTIAAPAVQVVDTTGAGDAFCGALAARLAEGADLTAAAGVGVIAGSLATTKAGAQPSMPTRAEIERFAESRNVS
jgi:ribokinase